ncbi:hypothetical protein [Runella sp. SP2]|uniref:hypothetical protein n=1 Tax=Runella sp. SP2 TaxID=2268026 RepID=UPI000F088E63|nr:hypothetical protein [Runella sp. SP2]AYQ36604.1 hypothetical protein DTQ70_30245 [Runella sp. SP2]
MNRYLFTIVCLLLITCLGASAQGDVYEYHPNSGLQLGYGFTKEKFTRFRSPFDEKNWQKNNTDVARNSVFKTSIVFDEETMKEKMHFDATIEGRYLIYEGSAGFELNTAKMFNANNLTILVEGRSDFVETTLDGLTLNQEAQRLVDAGNTAEFINRFGTNYVYAEKRAAAVYVLITINDVSRETQQQIGFNIQGGMDLGLYSASIKSSLNQEMANASRSGRIEVQVITLGGPGIKQFGELLRSLNFSRESMSSIQQKIANQFDKINVEQAVPVVFKTAPLSQFGSGYKDGLWTAQKDRMLVEVASENKRLTRISNIINTLLDDDEENYKRYLLSDRKRADLVRLKPEIDQRMQDLAQLHETIKDAANLNMIRVPKRLSDQIKGIVPEFPYLKVAFDITSGTFDLRNILSNLVLYADINTKQVLRTLKNMRILIDKSVAFDYNQETMQQRINTNTAIARKYGVYFYKLEASSISSTVDQVNTGRTEEVMRKRWLERMKNKDFTTLSDDFNANCDIEIQDVFGHSYTYSLGLIQNGQTWVLKDTTLYRGQGYRGFFKRNKELTEFSRVAKEDVSITVNTCIRVTDKLKVRFTCFDGSKPIPASTLLSFLSKSVLMDYSFNANEIRNNQVLNFEVPLDLGADSLLILWQNGSEGWHAKGIHLLNRPRQLYDTEISCDNEPIIIGCSSVDATFSGNRITYSDGTIYEGAIADCKPNGSGKLTVDGEIYEGEFLEGIPHGRNRLTRTDKSGNRLDNWLDGQWEHGQFLEGKAHQVTKSWTIDIKIERNQGVRVISGYKIFSNGQKYQGSFAEDGDDSYVEDGIGTLSDRDGKILKVGQWINGEFKG